MRVLDRLPRTLAMLTCAALALTTGCTSTGSMNSSTSKLTVSLSASGVVVGQDGYPSTLGLLVSGPAGTETVTESGLPTGVTAAFTPVNGTLSGTLTFTGSTAAAPGVYTPSVTVTVSAAGQTTNQSVTTSFTLTSAVVVKPGVGVNTSLGVGGAMKQVMSTGFQIAEWSPDLFGSGATTATQETQLTAMGPQHARLQALSAAIPMKSSSLASTSWDFTLLDKTAQPVLASADHGAEFQIAAAPAWMCLSNGNFDIANHLQDFADYAANLVRYYNTGGFNWGGVHFQSASSYPITWWGIFNEFNLNGLTVSDYIKLYNTVVPAMLAVDPTIKIVALELSDYGLGTGQAGDPELYLPAFVTPASSGGVKAQVDAVGTHLYAGCDQSYSDATLFAAVPDFVSNIGYFRQQLASRTDLANVPVWVTENNFNADYANASGMSSCAPTKTFVLDTRGTSVFFAAWRPYVFSQLAKAGNQALFHWEYTGDKQYGEVSTSGAPYLSYWVDRALANAFSSSAAGSQSMLSIASTDSSEVESMATVTSSGILRVLVVNRALASASDNNGTGAARTIVVDLTNYSLFYAASQTQVDANTSLTAGPPWAGVTPAARMTVTLPGYGMSILQLTP